MNRNQFYIIHGESIQQILQLLDQLGKLDSRFRLLCNMSISDITSLPEAENFHELEDLLDEMDLFDMPAFVLPQRDRR